MKRIVIMSLALGMALPLAASDRKFAASTLSGVRIQQSGRIVITNERNSIVAYQFDGDIRHALVRLRSTSGTLHYRPFGSVIYESDASVPGSVPPQVAKLIAEASREHGIDPRLVTALARQESGFDPSAVSRVGARGVMQLMPQTAQYLGVKDVNDVRQNIFGGVRYLRQLLDVFKGDLDLTLAAYNAGPGAVEHYGGVPPYGETVAYVASVRRMYEAFIR
ncbi:MAG: lytic transglycosylase domain-containing protein [Thermoanaerobaculia bacterium]